MKSRSTKIQWSRRVSPDKIRRLYESDARGMLDEELLDEVGYVIYTRCQDLLELAEANRGRVKCRGCGNVILRRMVNGRFDRAEILHCERCGWEIAVKDYHPSLLRKRPTPPYQPEEFYRNFVQEWPQAHTEQDKMLLIDRLIHEWHIQSRVVGWPQGTTVVKATAGEMIALLEGLSSGPGSTQGLEQTRQRWASRLKARAIRFDLEAAARDLGIAETRRMRKEELIEAIERAEPGYFEAWLALVYGRDEALA